MDGKHAKEIDENVKYSCFKKVFCTERRLRQHCWATNYQIKLNTQPAEPKPLDKPENIIATSTYKCEEYKTKQFSPIYEKIV